MLLMSKGKIKKKCGGATRQVTATVPSTRSLAVGVGIGDLLALDEDPDVEALGALQRLAARIEMTQLEARGLEDDRGGRLRDGRLRDGRLRRRSR